MSKYDSDPKFREQAKRLSRDYYRTKAGVVLGNHCADLVSVTAVVDGQAVEAVTLTAMADGLGLGPNTLYRWIREGRFPPAPMKGSVETTVVRKGGEVTVQRGMAVYPVDMASALQDVVCSHLDRFKYLRGDHSDTIAELRRIAANV